MVDSRKPYKREKKLEIFREEIHAILDEAKIKTDRAIDKAIKTYDRLENMMNKNANKVRSLKMKNHHKHK